MYPSLFTTPGVKAFAEEVDAERQRQLQKFGEQHHPDIEARDIPIVTHHYYASRADIWKQVNAERATPAIGGRCVTCPGNADGPHTHIAWDGILLEEVYEALAESDPAKLRAELIQTAAVCAAWVADIDSRGTAEEKHVVADSSADPEHVDDCPGCTPVDRAVVLREAADALDNSDRLRDHTDDHMRDVNAAADELRRMADEAQQS
ncbi:hypothetical protein [Streptomyces sp. BH055]|uniref:hypothetical protein n=1 Tax=Streptomyces sp. BH055 TaxID=3401173 RepID=UPI003BB52268